MWHRRAQAWPSSSIPKLSPPCQSRRFGTKCNARLSALLRYIKQRTKDSGSFALFQLDKRNRPTQSHAESLVHHHAQSSFPFPHQVRVVLHDDLVVGHRDSDRDGDDGGDKVMTSRTTETTITVRISFYDHVLDTRPVQ